ncbi:MAG: protein-glutamine gamma-glutamyltransferase [Actinomycetota bacterium]
MRRTLLVSALPAAVLAAFWLRLEEPRDHPGRAAAVAALALVPALVRPLAARAAASLLAGALAARLAFGLSLLHPRHFFGPLGSRFGGGFVEFYDVRVPFDPRVHADMRAVILVAVFGFVLALGLAVAARRPLPAALVVLGGAGWPATLVGPRGALAGGVAILLATLGVLAGVTPRRLPRVAVPAAAGLALAALLASTSPAVAKGELVHWQGWNFFTAQTPPVSVAYVWNAQYEGLDFPQKRTTVLEIRAPQTALYWRAAVLDAFARDRWLEGPPHRDDALAPPAARNPRGWVREDVTVKALSDTRLVAASVPVRFSAGDAPLVRTASGGALLPSGLTPGFRYTAWSYAPQPRPAELARSRPLYPPALVARHAFLDVWPGVTMPPYGAARRAARVRALVDANGEVQRYAPLERTAFAVARGARSPYAAAVSLESWFRSRGGFTYTNQPAVFAPAPLVGFVVQTRAGYCQYFAGAMALMLRYLGVPARVAVGFSSGTYDPQRGVWTVTDHDAHAWVEAWFRGYGWLPFDPTPPARRPERGHLSAPYSAASLHFSLRRATGGAGNRVPPSPPRQSAHRHGEPRPGSAEHAATPTRPARRHGSLLLLLALIVAAALAGVALTKLAVRRLRYLSRDPRRVASACRRELAEFLIDQRLDAARTATLHELAALVLDQLTVDAGSFVSAATAARFGRPAGARAAAADARRELRALVRRIRGRLTVRERVRGLLSLRSFGLTG